MGKLFSRPLHRRATDCYFIHITEMFTTDVSMNAGTLHNERLQSGIGAFVFFHYFGMPLISFIVYPLLCFTFCFRFSSFPVFFISRFESYILFSEAFIPPDSCTAPRLCLQFYCSSFSSYFAWHSFKNCTEETNKNNSSIEVHTYSPNSCLHFSAHPLLLDFSLPPKFLRFGFWDGQ